MKLWGGRFTKETNQLVHNFNASLSFDQKFYKEDIEGSIAHVTMLAKQGILSEDDKESIIEGLNGIRRDIENGTLTFTQEHEDIHSFVEANLIDHRLDGAVTHQMLQIIFKEVGYANGFDPAVFIKLLHASPNGSVLFVILVWTSQFLPRLRSVNKDQVNIIQTQFRKGFFQRRFRLAVAFDAGFDFRRDKNGLAG